MQESVIAKYLKDANISDPVISDLVKDRNEKTEELKATMEKLKAMNKEFAESVAKFQLDISTVNGAINYIDSKIVARHNDLTKE